MMIAKLILKDIRGYWRFVVLSIFSPGIAWSLLLFIPYYHWSGFVLFCSFAIFAAISYFSFSEKKQHIEILTCSLPVTRTAIVLSRYLLALIITFVGIILYYATAYVGDFIYPHSVTTFSQINHPKVLLMSLFFISIISSIFLPGIFSLKITGMIFNFAIAMIGGLSLTYKIFHPKQGFHESDFESFDVMILICAMMLALFFSVVLSLSHYQRKDL
jgi:hypothetical protein